MAIRIESDTGNITAGGDSTDGDLLLNSNDGQRRIHLDAGSGNAYLGGNGADGDLVLMPAGASSQSGSSGTIHMSGDSGNYRAGGNGADGDVILRSSDGQDRIRLDAGGGNAWLGGNGADGDLVLFASDGNNTTLAQSTIHMNGEEGNYRAGGSGTDGDITLQSTTGENRIRLDAGGGNMWIGGNGADGDIVVFASTGDNSTLANATIHINGDAGDIVMQNADFAEEFDISEATPAVEPGDVMVMGQSSALEPCQEAYDARAVGIVSGAGDYRPGIVLDRQLSAGVRLPVALVGKVFVKVDATYGAVAVGDMLTTSPTPGHAMRVNDRAQAFGATLGKAMAPLDDGTGMIPVLVNLQ